MSKQLNEGKELTNIVQTIYRGTKKFGFSAIKKKIKQLYIDDNYSERENEIIGIIEDLSCREYRISRQELREKKSYGEATNARKICFVLFKKHLKFNRTKIAKHFKRHPQYVDTVFREIKNLNVDIRPDRELLQDYNKIDKLVDNYINNVVK